MIRLLIIDDVEETRDILARMLRPEHDIEIVGTGSNGLEAIDLYGQLLPDVIVMGVLIPHMDGITPLQRIRDTLSLSCPLAGNCA